MNIKMLYAQVLGGISAIAGVDAAKKFDAQLRFHKKTEFKKIRQHCRTKLLI